MKNPKSKRTRLSGIFIATMLLLNTSIVSVPKATATETNERFLYVSTTGNLGVTKSEIILPMKMKKVSIKVMKLWEF